jgi:hypothetical protein
LRESGLGRGRRRANAAAQESTAKKAKVKPNRAAVDAAPDQISATEACGPHKRLFATPFDLENLHTVSYM